MIVSHTEYMNEFDGLTTIQLLCCWINYSAIKKADEDILGFKKRDSSVIHAFCYISKHVIQTIWCFAIIFSNESVPSVIISLKRCFGH